jgi:hypothetical protein
MQIEGTDYYSYTFDYIETTNTIGVGLHLNFEGDRATTLYIKSINVVYDDTTLYDLWIGGRRVTNAPSGLDLPSDSVSAIGGDFYSVTFDPSGNKLTLSNIDLKSAITSKLSNLEISIIGNNKVNTSMQSNNAIIDQTTSAEISFSTNSNEPGALTLFAKENYDVITGFTNSTSPAVNNGLVWQPTEVSGKITSATISILNYNLTVAGSPVTSANAGNILKGGDNDGKVSFTPANETDNTPATLTLDGATINYSVGNVIISTLDQLVVNLVGNSTIDCGGGKAFNGSASNLSFTTSSTSPGSLTMKSTHSDFGPNNYSEDISSISYQEGMGAIATSNSNPKEVIIAWNYGLTIGGAAVTSASLGEGGSITGFANAKFAPATTSPVTDATLTLTGVELTGCIEWNNSKALTIALSGPNSISNTSGAAIIGNGDTNSTLKFVKASEEGTCELVLTGKDGVVISGFSNDAYVSSGSGLYYLPESTTITSTLLGGGSGTSADPFLIKNLNDLKNFAKYVNEGILTSEFVQLENTIDCSEIDNFEPIGKSNNPFIGTFDGNGETISNLTIEYNSGAAGLFSKIGEWDYSAEKSIPGSVLNLTLDHCSISNNNNSSGGIAGQLYSGTIENCSVINNSSIVSTYSHNPSAGGIVGEVNNNSKVYKCQVSNTTISSTTQYSYEPGKVVSGGIVGWCENIGVEIELCTVSNAIISSEHTNSDTTPGNNSSSYTIVAGGIFGYTNENLSEFTCTFKNNNIKESTISSSSILSERTYAGAIIGKKDSKDELYSLEENYYESSVTTKTKSVGATDFTTKSGNTQRGIGDSDDIIENSGAMLAGTKSITIGCFVHESNEASSYYYSSFDEENEISTVLDLPENNTVICLSLSDLVEAEGSTAKFTITNASTNKEIDATIEDVKEDNVYSYTKISFTMPDADVTIAMDIFAIPVSLSELGFVDENQTSSTYFSTEKNWNVPEGIVAYVITGISGSNVITSRVSSIPKGVPVFLEKGSSTEEPKDNSNNILYGTVEATDVTSISGGTVYVLYNNMFVKSTSGTIPAHRCYLLIGNSVATTRGFGIDHGDGTSGIREVKSGEVKGEKLASGEWFDLQGRRLNAKPNKSGLYILNGRKVVIK